MWSLIAIALSITACGKSSKPKPVTDPAAWIEAAKSFADRACVCQTDKDCLHGVRDEFDAQKAQLLAATFAVPDDKAKFDAEILRLRSCGDAGGLTIWLQ
ncbi:MAG: hypothetical protein JWO36_830 [Myxococcales bacterium]|nr:hypothetical protein [Myxococcales bacterium]